MTRVTDNRRKAATLRAARPGAFRPLTLSPEMRAAAARCQQPTLISMASRVTEETEIARKRRSL